MLLLDARLVLPAPLGRARQQAGDGIDLAHRPLRRRKHRLARRRAGVDPGQNGDVTGDAPRQHGGEQHAEREHERADEQEIGDGAARGTRDRELRHGRRHHPVGAFQARHRPQHLDAVEIARRKDAGPQALPLQLVGQGCSDEARVLIGACDDVHGGVGDAGDPALRNALAEQDVAYEIGRENDRHLVARHSVTR